MATFRTTGEVKSLPRRNNWGQLQYRVAVDAKFAAEINAAWEAAVQATPKACLNTTAPAWLNEETGVWTVTVGTGKAGMYPAGVSYGKPCNVSFRIGADKYTQVIASATEEVAAANAVVAVEKMEAVREALESREFTEKVSGVNAKLRSMSELASETGIPLSDLMSADKIISDEKEKVAAAKRSATKKGSTLRRTPAVAKGDDAKSETETVVLTAKTITKWQGLSDNELRTAMETYADMVGVAVEDVEAAWVLATAEQD